MMIILQILGGIFLAIILLALGLYLFFRIKFGKFLHYQKQKEALYIHLIEDVSPDWLDNKKARMHQSTIQNLGFEASKCYLVNEMPDIEFQAFFQAPITAVLYKHSIAGYWVDMVIETADEEVFAFTNLKFSTDFDIPKVHKVRDPKASIQDLYELATQQLTSMDKDYKQINVDNFRTFFEKGYEREIAWKNRKGGISREEFNATADDAAFKSNEKNRELAFIETKQDELELWHEASIERYCRDNNMTDKQRYEAFDNMLAIPFTTHPKALLNYLEFMFFLTETQVEKLSKIHTDEQDTFALFEQINALFSPDLQAKFVTEVTFPLQMKLYRRNKDIMEHRMAIK